MTLSIRTVCPSNKQPFGVKHTSFRRARNPVLLFLSVSSEDGGLVSVQEENAQDFTPILAANNLFFLYRFEEIL